MSILHYGNLKVTRKPKLTEEQRSKLKSLNVAPRKVVERLKASNHK